MKEQPEALRLAEKMEDHRRLYGETVYHKAADELRRQHGEIESMRAERMHTERRLAAVESQRDALLCALRYWLPDETMIPAGHEARWHEAVAAITALNTELEREPAAWMHPDGRVIPAETMGSARKDGGAMLSSLREYTIPLVPLCSVRHVVRK